MNLTPPPSPAEATDEAAFVAELRGLKTWSGMSFRQLERRATAAGDTLPASTVATMLARNRLPRQELLVAFIRACGLDGEDMRPWLTTRAALADGKKADVTAVARATAHRRDTSFQWRRALVAVAALAVAFAGGAALTAGLDSNSIEEQETVVLTP